MIALLVELCVAQPL